MNPTKKGYVSSISSYIIWGLLPLYWSLLHHIAAYNVLSHRIIWSGLCMIVVAVIYNFSQFKKDVRHLKENPMQIVYLFVAAIMIGLNWGVYIWAIAHDQVMDTSLGYYINPLLNVLVGVFLFKESLQPIQWVSVGLAGVGILYLTIQLGSLPLVSLLLALSFCLYGMVKKKLLIHPFTSIAFESWIVTPLALAYTLGGDTSSWQYFIPFSSTALLFIISGLTTSVPLILFSYGAKLLPLNLLGFLQYVSPTIALCLAIFYFEEPFTSTKMIAFLCIWSALVLYTLSNWKQSGRK